MTGLIILPIILIVTALILFAPVYVDFEYIHDAVADRTSLYLKYLFIKINLSDRKAKKKSEREEEEKAVEPFSLSSFKKRFDRGIRIFDAVKDDAAELFDYLAHRAVLLKLFDFSLIFGFEDAMSTGMMTGVISAAAYNILAFVDNHMVVSDKKMDIRPDFENVCFNASFRCIVRIKIVHIMVIAVKGLMMYIKVRKIK